MAAGWKLRKQSGEEQAEQVTISSQTLTAGDVVFQSAGGTTFAAGTSSTTLYERKGICQEDATTSDTLVSVTMVTADQEWEVESANSSSASDTGDAMVLTDKNTVNNSGTNSTAKEAVVVQIRPVGAASDKRILVKFTGTSSGLSNAAA